MKDFNRKFLINALLLGVFVFGLVSHVNGQQMSVSGTVRSQDGTALEGVSVMVLGTSNQGTSTDEDGFFELPNVTKGDKLLFSSIGYTIIEVPVVDDSELNIVLQPQQYTLEEVVVDVGYGTVKKKDLTGAVADVSGQDLASRNQVKVSQALQGTTAGVMVTRSGGAPDAPASIRIRGVTTIGNSEPLIIVDGIPGNLDWINPNDIESITVLKDAASASIYGSRAASGVILVTTKRATEGQLSLDYNYEFTIQKPTEVARNVGAQDYMRVLNERNWNDSDNTGSEFPIYPEQTIANYAQLHAENPDLYPDVAWLPLLMRETAPRHSHSISVAGGTENVKSKVGLVFDKIEGFYNHKSYDRLIFNANNDFNVSDKVSFQLDLRGIYSENNHPIYKVTPSSGVAPIYPALWSDGRIGSGKAGVNPYASLNYGGSDKLTANSIMTKLAVNYNPIEDLTLTAVVAPQLYSSKDKRFVKQLEYSLFDDPNIIAGPIEGHTQTYLDEGRTDNTTVTTQFLANYSKDMGDHSLNVMIGNENYNFFQESLGARREQYGLSDFPYLNLGNENYQYNSGGAYENAYRSFFGRLMYNYKGRYYLQGNVRYDGSSRFHSDYRWGAFPSVSAGWIVSDEAFLDDVSFLSYFKIRASYGTLGNERIGNYPYQATIGFGNSLFYTEEEVVSTQTAAITKYAIPDISWEKTSSFDVGFDASFVSGKLGVTADYYKKTTEDMLLALEIPDYIGLSDPEQNTGRMFTRGWELEVEWRDHIGDFGYSVSANISDSRSIMGDLGGTQFLGSQVKYEGSEFNEWYGYRSVGLYQTSEQVDASARLNNNVGVGDVQYQDISGPDGIPDGKISAEYDRVLLGGSLPRYLYGGVVRAFYKNLEFSISFQGIGKQNERITDNMIEPFRSQYIEVPELIMGNYWSRYNTDEQNRNARYPRISTAGAGYNYAMSDYWLFSGAYMRIKNIMLGYSLPESVISNVGLKRLMVYFNVTDLPAFHNYPNGWDPEGTSYWIPTGFTMGARIGF